MGDNKKNVEPSDFLKKLHTAVTTGDPSKGLDAIKKINEIHKLADGMDSEVAGAKNYKRIEEAGIKEEISPEERKVITLQNEKDKIKREEEELKLKMEADIQNAEYEITATNKELEEVQEQYKKVILALEEQLDILKIKYEAKYGKDND